MKLQDGSSIVAGLTTIGRKTGEQRAVELRHNMLQTPAVELKAQGERFSCMATQVTDGKLRRYILTLRDSPPRMDRVVFEIKPIS